MATKNLLFAVGGTGGHVFPALALAEECRRIDPRLQVLFAGGGLKQSHFFGPESPSYVAIPSASFSFSKPFSAWKGCVQMGKGVQASIRLLREFSPSLIVGFGSYYSFPVLSMACALRYPYILDEQNAIPGRVTRLFAKGAQFTAIHYESAQHYLGKNCVLAKLPLRWRYRSDASLKREARNYFGLRSERPVVLVFGGSQGAQSINTLVAQGLRQRPQVPFQIIHLTGNIELADILQKEYTSLGIAARVKPFEERMDLAWSLADCAVSRAGALSIAEQIEFEVPGILIPYPHAKDNHQNANAEHFTGVVCGGIKMLEGQFQQGDLVDRIVWFLNEENLNRMRRNIVDYKCRTIRNSLADAVIGFLNRV